MTNDFIPRADAELLVWLVTYKTNLLIHGAVVGLTPAQITAEVAAVDSVIAALTKAEAKRTDLSEAVAAKESLKTTKVKDFRATAAKIKTNLGYTRAIGQSLGIVGTTTTFDSENYKASISASIVAGCVRIKFTKNGVDGINIYNRKKGTAVWKFLARDTKSPYDDHIDLETAGQPEHWEYRAFGVIDDAEIGQPSDIVEIVFGG
jgi:hypothetical protein